MAIFIEDKPALGRTILLKLHKMKKTQKWLSEQTGYSYAHIHQICNGNLTPSIKCLYEISKVIDIPLGKLADAIEQEEKSGGNLADN